jgi:hypothetical protein
MTLWDSVTGWWTPGWGNLFTLAVAAAGIAVSAWFNRRTLLATNEKFQRQLREARHDKLRVEVAELLSDTEELRVQTIKLGNRLSELSKKTYSELSELPESDKAASGAVVARYKVEAQGAVTELVSDLYTRLAVRGVTIMMLTSDDQILEPMNKIQKLIDEDRHDFDVLVMAREVRQLSNERGDTMPDRHESRRGDILTLVSELSTYCIETFRRLDD